MTFGILVYLNLLYVIFATPSNSGQTSQFQMATGMMITILIPKLFILTVLFGEDIIRVIQKIISWIGSSSTQPIPGRRKFISQLALILAAMHLEVDVSIYACWWLILRVIHGVTYLMAIPLIRTIAYFGSIICMVMMALALV